MESYEFFLSLQKKAWAQLFVRSEEAPIPMQSQATLTPRHVLLFCAIIIALLAIALLVLYFCCRNKNGKRRRQYDDQVVLMPKKKRVRRRREITSSQVVVKKTRNLEDSAREGWADIPSSYHIQVIEEIVSATRKTTRSRLNSERTLLSDYEVDPDPVWEVPRHRLGIRSCHACVRLQLVEQLGEGAFGEVWKGLLKNPAKSSGEKPAEVFLSRNLQE